MNDTPNWKDDLWFHRTVGPHRAWCHTDREWCYPNLWCDCCRHEKKWVDQEGNPVEVDDD